MMLVGKLANINEQVPEKTSSTKYLSTKEIQSSGPPASQYTYYIEIDRSLLMEPEVSLATTIVANLFCFDN
jgi:hypothetical protein